MDSKTRLIQRILTELPEVPISPIAELYSYRGPKDAGQMSWETIGINGERICSCDSITTLLKAKKIGTTKPGDYRSNGWEIGIIEN